MLKIFVPITSAGIRSAVHCTRWKPSPQIFAKVLTASVLASPGTPSISVCPPQISTSSS